MFPQDRSRTWWMCGLCLALAMLAGRVSRAEQRGTPGRSQTSTAGEAEPAIDVTIGSREVIRQRTEMPFVMDGSLATLRHDKDSWFFYHSEDWGKSHDKYCGTASNPFQTHVWHKDRNQMFDLNGRYANVHHAGLWLMNIYQVAGGELLGVVHIELHYQAPAVNQGEDYALGVVHSSDGGERWTFCGEIVRPKNSKGNVGGAPLLAVGDYFHVYFNEHGPDGTRPAVARAKMADVLAAARDHKVTAWRKHRDGSWEEDGLTGLASNVLPNCAARGGHPTDLHADAAYNRAVGLYMITCWCYQERVGRLYLQFSSDGIHFQKPYLLDEEPGQWMPYSTFLAHERDQDTNDMSTVGADFYVLINHKSASNYGIDTLWRKKIHVARK